MAEKYNSHFKYIVPLISTVTLIFKCGLKDNDEKRIHSKAK